MTPLLHKVEGLVQSNPLRVHEVGQTDGGRAGDSCLTVDQHTTTTVLHCVCGRRQKEEDIIIIIIVITMYY